MDIALLSWVVIGLLCWQDHVVATVSLPERHVEFDLGLGRQSMSAWRTVASVARGSALPTLPRRVYRTGLRRGMPVFPFPQRRTLYALKPFKRSVALVVSRPPRVSIANIRGASFACARFADRVCIAVRVRILCFRACQDRKNISSRAHVNWALSTANVRSVQLASTLIPVPASSSTVPFRHQAMIRALHITVSAY